MKFLQGLFIALVVAALWSASSVMTAYRLNQLVERGIIPYGPLPEVGETYYSYDGIEKAFVSTLEIKRAKEFDKKEFEQLILSSLPAKAQLGIKPYIASILNFSVDYQMDPFWIISVIMVESNFNLTAKSVKDARGLMQVRPETAAHLYQLMSRNVSAEDVLKNLYHPEENIEVGIFYLKKLLHNFRFDYRFATVAYNIGPGKLRSRLGSKSIDVNNFSYFKKVKDKYKLVSQFYMAELKKRPMPFELSYVVQNQGLDLEEKVFDLSHTTGSENLLTASFRL